MARAPLDPDGGEPSEPVGPGRPPKRHRIRNGEIRNPYGRRGKPKQPVDFLDEIVTIRVDGEPRKVTRDAALDFFLFAKAAKGEVRAIRSLEDRRRKRHGQTSDPGGFEWTAEDKAAFDRFVSRAAQDLKVEGSK